MSSRWTARIKVEEREACFKRLRKHWLGGSKETDTGQNTGDPRVMESSMLKSVIIWKMGVTCESLAQAGMLTEIKDVDNLKILIEEVRLDQDIKAQVYVILCELEYRMPYF